MASKDFLLLLGSGITIAAVDALIEIGAPGIIPQTPSPLPPGDDLISLGISAVPAIIGKVTKKPLYSSIGEGMLLYSGPTALKDSIVRAAMPPQLAVAKLVARKSMSMVTMVRPGLTTMVRYGPEQSIVTAPKFTPGVLTPKYGLGA